MPTPQFVSPRIEAATRSAPGRPNQDRVLVLPQAIAVLDGATDRRPQGDRDGGWYADRLAEALRVTLTPGRPVADGVEQAIGDVARAHFLTPGAAPSATVAVATWDDDSVTGYLLGDSTLVGIPCEGPAHVLHDDRLGGVAPDVRRQYRARLATGRGFDGRHRDAVSRLMEVESLGRNRPGGYWIAEARPEAARHGLTDRWPRDQLRAVLLATDGAAAGLDYGLHPDWLDAASAIDAFGAEHLLARIEACEASDPDGSRWPRSKPSDDKTVIVARFG